MTVPAPGEWPCQYEKVTLVPHRLVTFLYILLRQVAHPGDIEQAAIDAAPAEGGHVATAVDFTNPHLESYARALAGYLIAPWDLDRAATVIERPSDSRTLAELRRRLRALRQADLAGVLHKSTERTASECDRLWKEVALMVDLPEKPSGLGGIDEEGVGRDVPRTSAVGALRALVEALERGSPLFWTGNCLVEFDDRLREINEPPFAGAQATMVLDQDDLANLKALAGL